MAPLPLMLVAQLLYLVHSTMRCVHIPQSSLMSVHAGVGDLEVVFTDDEIVGREDVDIDDPRTEAFSAYAPEPSLEPQQEIEESSWFDVGVETGDGVDEFGLVDEVHRRGLDRRGDVHDRIDEVPDTAHGAVDVGVAVVEIGAEADEEAHDDRPSDGVEGGSWSTDQVTSRRTSDRFARSQRRSSNTCYQHAFSSLLGLERTDLDPLGPVT